MAQDQSDPDMKISLYVAGDAPSSRMARRVLNELLANGLAPGVKCEVVDVLREPARALQEGLLATPTLILEQRGQSQRYVGELGNRTDLKETIKGYCDGYTPANRSAAKT